MNELIADLLTQARRFSQSGNLEVAARKYQQILEQEPENPTVHFELGVVAFSQQRHQSAISHLRKAIELDPTQPVFHNGLGIAYTSTGDLPSGARCFERAVGLAPGYAVAHHNLGRNYEDQGRLASAADCYRKAISANPKYADAYINLAELLRRRGNLAAGTDVYRQALAAGTNEHAEIQFRLAVILHALGNDLEAATIFKAIVASCPEYPGIHSQLGGALIGLGRFDEAAASFKNAIDNAPDSATAHYNLGYALLAQIDLAGAVASYRKALAINPVHAQARSSLLLALHYLPNMSQEELYRESLQFETKHVSRIVKGQHSFHDSKDENKRLRIGYVSPDFRKHSVALFTKKIIGTHDRDQVEVFCYANIDAANQDQITAEFRTLADHWIPIFAITDSDVANRIREDQIDILIDLSGHTANNRLMVFAHRPAPIQVSWLGYPNTTGLACMDYRLTDAIADPPDATDQWHTEKLIRLPQGFLCYQPNEPSPGVARCPCLEQGYITYGSFNLALKITPDVVRIWSRILTTTADARLILKSSLFAHEKSRARCLSEFGKYGIATERVILLDFIPGSDNHLAAYSRIDVALDPFPYNGTATTCEALWMGVPVITLLGNRHSSRVGASILHRIGLPELVAASEDEYVERACALANDRQRLGRLRDELRPKIGKSALTDVERFTDALETVYRDLWKTSCDRHH